MSTATTVRYKGCGTRSKVSSRDSLKNPSFTSPLSSPSSLTLTSNSSSKMKFTFSTVLALLSLAAVGQSVSVSWDSAYDDSGASLATVACSDGTNGLLTKGFTTFGSLKNFPNIGGAPAVGGWNSASCGTCWKLTFNGKSINVLAIDVGQEGFNLSQEAMDKLTNGQAVALGRVDATATQVAASACGL